MSFLSKKNQRYYSFLFSDTQLKMGKVNPGGEKLENIFQFELPPNTILNGEIINPDQFTTLLTDIKNQLKLKDEYVIIGLSESRCFTYSLILPAIDIRDIDQAIEYKADTFLPFPYKNEYLDWRLTGILPDGRKKVLLTAIPKNLIDGYINCFEKVKLFPKSFSTTSLLIFKSLPDEGKKLSFAVEANNGFYVLLLCRENTIEACSVIYTPEELLTTLDKMTDFYLLQKGVKNFPKEIYLCGGNIETNLLDQLRNKKLEPLLLKPNIQGLPPERAGEFVTFLALCRKTVAFPEDEYSINILPKNLAVKYQKELASKNEAKISLFLLIILFLLTAVLILGNYFLFNRLKSLKTQSTKSNINKLNNLDNLKQYKSKINTINSIITKYEKLQELIILFNNKQEIKINTISYSDEKKEAYLAGISPDRDTLIKFSENLKTNKVFRKVTLPLSSLEKKINIEFRIIIQL